MQPTMALQIQLGTNPLPSQLNIHHQCESLNVTSPTLSASWGFMLSVFHQQIITNVLKKPSVSAQKFMAQRDLKFHLVQYHCIFITTGLQIWRRKLKYSNLLLHFSLNLSSFLATDSWQLTLPMVSLSSAKRNPREFMTWCVKSVQHPNQRNGHKSPTMIRPDTI